MSLLRAFRPSVPNATHIYDKVIDQGCIFVVFFLQRGAKKLKKSLKNKNLPAGGFCKRRTNVLRQGVGDQVAYIMSCTLLNVKTSRTNRRFSQNAGSAFHRVKVGG